MLSDMFTADQRGKAISIYSAAPLIGPVVGPIAGAWIAQKTTWRWVFRSSTIADAIVQLIGLCLLRESESSNVPGQVGLIKYLFKQLTPLFY